MISDEAAEEFKDAYRWYESQQAGLGDEFLRAAALELEALSDFPRRWPVLHRDTRRILLRRFPYQILIRIIQDTVVVVGCMHGRRDPDPWRLREPLLVVAAR